MPSNDRSRKEGPDMTKIHALLEPQAPAEAQLPPPSERVRLRKAQGLTQARIAEALGVTPGAVGVGVEGASVLPYADLPQHDRGHLGPLPAVHQNFRSARRAVFAAAFCASASALRRSCSASRAHASV